MIKSSGKELLTKKNTNERYNILGSLLAPSIRERHNSYSMRKTLSVY